MQIIDKHIVSILSGCHASSYVLDVIIGAKIIFKCFKYFILLSSLCLLCNTEEETSKILYGSS